MSDNQDKKKSSIAALGLPVMLLVLLVVATTATIIIQVSRADDNPTQTETTLFSILQFIFSLGFGWIVTRISSKREFEESQKQFAIAAYRRIREIEGGVERLLSRLRERMTIGPPEARQDLEVALAIALGVRASIRSSVADWGDVIGEEIITIERIANIRADTELIDSSSESQSAAAVPAQLHDRAASDRTEGTGRVGKLIESLPPSLQILETSADASKLAVRDATNRMRGTLARKGYVALAGFWDQTFAARPDEHELGATVHLRLADVGARTGILAAHFPDGRSFGVVTNSTNGKYRDFLASLEDVFNRSSFEAELFSVERTLDTDRCYFTVKIDKSAIRTGQK